MVPLSDGAQSSVNSLNVIPWMIFLGTGAREKELWG